MSILSILRPIGKFCGHLVYVFPFWYVVPRKIWQPWPELAERRYKSNQDGLLETMGTYFWIFLEEVKLSFR
jgi:hypothetical protein